MQQVKILVVEDDHVSQRVVQLMLEGKGYAVDIAGTGEQARALYQANRYDLVLMDLGLPDMTGFEITLKMRTIDLKLGIYTPIIALTAHGDFAKQECLAAGMDDFISKPIEIESLNQMIKRWITKAD